MKNLLNEKIFNIIMTTAVLLILVIPVGLACVYLGFYKGESPCLLCGHERFGMILVGILGIFMLRYGVKIKYIVSVFIVAFWFLFEGLRHVGNHGPRDVGMGFGEAMFGLHTYSWAFVVYWVVVLAMALMMLFIRGDNNLGKEIFLKDLLIKDFSPYTKGVASLSLIIVLLNAFQFFFTNGIPPYGGSGSPARFTLNLGKAASYWDDHHWYEGLFKNPTLLGQNQGPKPYVPGINENKKLKFNPNFADIPITNLGEKLSVLDTKEIGFKALSAFNKGVAGGIAYDKARNEFAIISTGAAVYFTDENFKEAKEFAKIDQVNGMDIPISVDATFYASGKLVATAMNKTIWGIERTDNIDAKKQWKFIREVKGNLMPMFGGSRKPVQTTRAKRNYILSLAKDPDSIYAYMVSIKAVKSPKIALLKYDTTDSTISEETILLFSDEAGAKQGAKTSDFYITGSDISNGKMFALSKNFNALVIIDLASKSIEKAFELPQIGDFHDIAIVDDKLFVLSRIDNKDKVFVLNNPL